jgi:hypothetical protein
MHKLLFPALLAAGLGTASAATATTEVGLLESVDPATAQVSFIDGETFNFPNTPGYRAHLSEFHPGEMVAIAIEGDNKDNWSADAMWLAQPVFGYTVP